MIEVISDGFFGTVIRDPDSDGVIKMIAPHQSPSYWGDTFIEGQILHDITYPYSHPNIVDYIGHSENSDGLRRLKMEDLRSYTPLNSIDKLHNNPTRLLTYAYQAAGVLDYINFECDVIHRDIKPAHILVSRNGKVKVIDFGLAIKLVTPTITEQWTQGTYFFMPPERLRGITTYYSDQISLGLTLLDVILAPSPVKEGLIGQSHDIIGLYLSSRDGMYKTESNAIDKSLYKPSKFVFNRVLSNKYEQRFPSSTAFVEALIKSLGLSLSEIRDEVSRIMNEI